MNRQDGFPTKCIFCQEDRPLTNEDYWPKWLQRHHPSPFKKSVHQTRVINSDGTLGPFLNNVNRNRGPLNMPLKVVCAHCNNGWMSRIQKIASPHLKPLVDGNWIEPSEDAQKIIASWTTMFVMVYDFAHMETQSISHEERSAFRSSASPLNGWIVSIGRMKNTVNHGKVWKRTVSISSSIPNAVNDRKYVQSTILAAGYLIIHAASAPTSEIQFNPLGVEASLGLSVIWPSIRPSIKRPLSRVSVLSGFDKITASFDRMLQQGRP